MSDRISISVEPFEFVGEDAAANTAIMTMKQEAERSLVDKIVDEHERRMAEISREALLYWRV